MKPRIDQRPIALAGFGADALAVRDRQRLRVRNHLPFTQLRHVDVKNDQRVAALKPMARTADDADRPR